jgi:hypothetical protein
MGFGGTMTYGVTVGLTHNPEVVGNWDALRWGLLGCAVKGGVWIGLAGVFLGMGLSEIRYRPAEMLMLMLAMIGAFYIGTRLLNSPFYPTRDRLPLVFFSDIRHWVPESSSAPRRESWGGLWFALIAATVYSGWSRKDTLARKMTLWGIIGGALGFPLGQSIQAFHAWHPEVFQTGIWEKLGPHINWWNMMETTFGTVMGGALGLGLWLNRKRIGPADAEEATPSWELAEWLFIALHAYLLTASEFLDRPVASGLYGFGLILGIVPIVASTRGRWWPYFLILPLTLLVIAGKTVRQLVYKEESISPEAGWFWYLIFPMAIMTTFALWYAIRNRRGRSTPHFSAVALLLCVWTYFLLNYAFFHFPWPWAEWTYRTPNGIIFTIYAFGLTGMVFARLRHRRTILPE